MRLVRIRADLDHQDQNLLAWHWTPYIRHIHVVGLLFLHAQMVGSAALAQFAPDLARCFTEADAVFARKDSKPE